MISWLNTKIGKCSSNSFKIKPFTTVLMKTMKMFWLIMAPMPAVIPISNWTVMEWIQMSPLQLPVQIDLKMKSLLHHHNNKLNFQIMVSQYQSYWTVNIVILIALQPYTKQKEEEFEFAESAT